MFLRRNIFKWYFINSIRFKRNRINKKSVELIEAKDYDGMYDYAYGLMAKRCGSTLYKCKQLYKRILASV